MKIKLPIALWISLFMTVNTALSAQSETSGLKWHPGHYIMLNGFSDRPELIRVTQELEGYTAVKGCQIRYRWKDLEPEKDDYNFSSVISDLKYLDSIGKFLVIQLQFKSFNNNAIYTPDYLENDLYDGGIYNMSTGGWNLRLWNVNVAGRLNQLLEALGDSLNLHPALALVNLAESAAPTAIEPELADWKPFRNSFLENLAKTGYLLREAFPNTPTISYFNSGPADALLFEEVAMNSGHGTGGPDVYIGAYEKELHLRHAYDYTQRVAGKVPIGYGVQWHNYTWVGASSAHADPRGAVPPIEHFEFARDILKTNFLFWVRRDPYWNDVKVLLSNLSLSGDPAGGLVSDCPSLLDLVINSTAPSLESHNNNLQLKCCPNPFHENATLKFHIPEPGFISLKIYTLCGILKETIVNEYMETGNYQLNYTPDALNTGLYFARLQTKLTNTTTTLICSN